MGALLALQHSTTYSPKIPDTYGSSEFLRATRMRHEAAWLFPVSSACVSVSPAAEDHGSIMLRRWSPTIGAGRSLAELPAPHAVALIVRPSANRLRGRQVGEM